MSGKTENDKKGSSGKAASKQSKQANISDGQSAHETSPVKRTGGKPSKQQTTSAGSANDRGQSKKAADKKED